MGIAGIEGKDLVVQLLEHLRCIGVDIIQEEPLP
jgi:hypothetical protein